MAFENKAPVLLTAELLVVCGASRTAAVTYAPLLNELLPYYEITTLLRVCHFLGQVLHESNGLRAVEEYDSGAAYEGRQDPGNIQPGDGIRFKGRGLMQVTGRANYAAFARRFKIDCVTHPELLEQPRWALATALWYWGTRALNVYADRDDTLGVSQIINLGSVPKKTAKRQLPNGWREREHLVERCKTVLTPVYEHS